MREVYLDWAATAPPDPLFLDIMHETATRYYGNPSSVHRAGTDAAAIMEEARARLARGLGCLPETLFFTSGATESNNMTIQALVKRALVLKKDFSAYTVITSAIEHASLWEPAQMLKKLGFGVKTVRPDAGGIIQPGALARLMDKQTAVVMIMGVNNETGAVQPVKELVRGVRDFSAASGKNILFHCDLVQALGKLPLSLRDLDVDSASISAHKIGGLKGTGALYLKTPANLDFLSVGGGQEKGVRPGTENTAAIAAFAALAEKQQPLIRPHLEQSREKMDMLISEIGTIPAALIFPECRTAAADAHYSPYILSLAFPPLPGEVAVRILNDHNIYVSAGSACHSHKKERTRVVESMGVPKALAECMIRVSIGPATTSEDIAAFLQAARKHVAARSRIGGPRSLNKPQHTTGPRHSAGPRRHTG